MHELALTNNIIRILEEQARSGAFTRVTTVWLDIGALSQVEPEAVRFCFDAASRGTIAEGATLVILEPPGEAWCMDCSKTVVVSRRGDACPDCGGFKLNVTGGTDLRVREMEVE
ncbi:MAG: hydrogenase maturation nickel metallochaperone HypA [Alphaproteobacteria bacterium]